MELKLSEVIGGGYKDFWNCKKRYRIVKGSRASKKSKTMALWTIVNMMKYPDANMVVVRKTFNTLRTSCYADLKWACERLGVTERYDFTINPLEITDKVTGQKIYFRGLDNGVKITSISVSKGSLCWCWIEEAYEISNEEDFDKLDMSIRGQVANGLFKQITLTFNPWSEQTWIKKRFFDRAEKYKEETGEDDPDIFTKTTNYMCNEFLDDADLKTFERMKKDFPRRYNIEGLGNWGIAEGLIYENFEVKEFNFKEISKMPSVQSVFGLDFGYTNDPTALFCGLVDSDNKCIYVFDEMYQKAMTNEDIAKKVTRMGYSKEKIVCDSAEPKSIDRLKTLGLRRVKKARKGRDSINNGIDYIQDFKIFIHPKCSNFIKEINNYSWDKDKNGRTLNKPIDDFNHLMDAMRYAMGSLQRGSLFEFC